MCGLVGLFGLFGPVGRALRQVQEGRDGVCDALGVVMVGPPLPWGLNIADARCACVYYYAGRAFYLSMVCAVRV